MIAHQPKEYFGIVGNNQEIVNVIYEGLASKIHSKIITSLNVIAQPNTALGAIAYLMDYPSELHKNNLEYIYRNCPQKSLYIVSNQISIPMLHHALRLRVRDVFKIPLDIKTIDKLALELSQTTKIDCIEQPFLPPCSILSTQALITHPLEALFTIIEENFVAPPSLLDVSRSMFLSPSRISHLFKDLCGIGYCQYILCRRLEESEYLLSLQNAIITNISFQLGFSNPSHFCRNFKEHLGLTPTACINNEKGIELSCLYQRYLKLRMELFVVSSAKQSKLSRLASR
ncbi:helix-turn-helix transcriptional regulator [Colwellia sp. BRX10-3]|uniref:helix-turn-helix transcriptional regulator n=1 Tax=Colwellia sp. BRX10-3 TaxID=2759844 RepID=UPI0015F36E06|nr:AraC family transcriptional regulator [Colwellia sp. BRX10-3]MBA6390717.1 helix-turn-helix transcriptional regulator [Colwellia sp. BRX10-3]